MDSAGPKCPRLAVVIFAVAVVLELSGKGACNIVDCPNGVKNITAKSGMFESPNFPNKYGINETICWFLKAPKHYWINVIIHSFELELCQFCDCDFVQISRVSFTSGNKRCGTYTANYLKFREDLNSPELDQLERDNEVYVRFKTDDTGHFSGFNASFYATSPQTGNEFESFLNATEDETLTFTSPEYVKGKYPANIVGQWILIVPEGRQVSLTFDTFELESSPDCENDWVELREAVKTSDPREISGNHAPFVSDRLCGSSKPTVTYQSSGNMMFVQFRADSNSTTTYKGFSASFKAGVTGLSAQTPSFPLLTAAFLLIAFKFGLY